MLILKRIDQIYLKSSIILYQHAPNIRMAQRRQLTLMLAKPLIINRITTNRNDQNLRRRRLLKPQLPYRLKLTILLISVITTSLTIWTRYIISLLLLRLLLPQLRSSARERLYIVLRRSRTVHVQLSFLKASLVNRLTL